jgi:hypothetical protein
MWATSLAAHTCYGPSRHSIETENGLCHLCVSIANPMCWKGQFTKSDRWNCEYLRREQCVPRRWRTEGIFLRQVFFSNQQRLCGKLSEQCCSYLILRTRTVALSRGIGTMLSVLKKHVYRLLARVDNGFQQGLSAMMCSDCNLVLTLTAVLPTGRVLASISKQIRHEPRGILT